MRAACTVAVVLGLLVPGGASAGPLIPPTFGRQLTAWVRSQERLQVALQRAGERWPGVCQPVQVVTEPLPGAALGQAQIGATDGCVIDLSPVWPTWPWWALCALVMHEVGHLDGQQHSTDPNNVMYPHVVTKPPLCRADWRPVGSNLGSNVP